MEHKLRFIPFSSSFDINFWQKIHDYKLKKLQLDDEPLNIMCAYDFAQEYSPPFINFQSDSFSQSLSNVNFCDTNYMEQRLFWCACKLKIFNSLEEFHNFDKMEIFNYESNKLSELIEKEDFISCVRELCPTYLNVFVDLKHYKFNYWAIFPSVYLSYVPVLSKPMESLSKECYKPIVSLLFAYFKMKTSSSHFCCFGIHQDINQVCTLFEALEGLRNNSSITLVIANPSCLEANPGWPIRNLLIYVGLKIKSIKTVSIICLAGLPYSLEVLRKSVIFNVSMDFARRITLPLEMLGCELSIDKEEKSRYIDLKQHLDPLQLVGTSNSLNLQLMKWRMAPDLNLDKIENLRCLILGAGTLGCNVARGLLAWNVKQISFVDNGYVSLASPIRQSLYTFEDGSREEKQRKVDVAVRRCLAINPSAIVEGHFLTIPSLGHRLAESEKVLRQDAIRKLEDLITDHDVIMLLTDTRTSRWLPTVIGCTQLKLVLTAAVGFDTYLVMRHGVHTDHNSNRLGCYFCSDVAAPSELNVDRTIDQRCTITRPGLSMITAGMLVELLVNICHHPLGKRALADKPGLMGSVPHSIRGFIHSFNTCYPTVTAFSSCTACSMPIQTTYRCDGIQFLERCLDDPSHLEHVTGMDKLKKACENEDEYEEFLVFD